jgi:hypothetical protein
VANEIENEIETQALLELCLRLGPGSSGLSPGGSSPVRSMRIVVGCELLNGESSRGCYGSSVSISTFAFSCNSESNLGAGFLSRSEVAHGHSPCFSIDPQIGVSDISVRDGGIRKHRILRAIVGTASLCRFEDANTPVSIDPQIDLSIISFSDRGYSTRVL